MAKTIPTKPLSSDPVLDAAELEFDFGFSFSEDTKENIESDKKKLEDVTARLHKLHSAIIPFLNNLCKNPEKDTIVWPNRVEKIEEYKKKLEQIVNGV